MDKCWSPITPLVALVSLEVALFAGLLGWSLLAWTGLLVSGPTSGLILGAIIVNGVITLSLPLVYGMVSRLRRVHCPDYS